MRKAGAAWAGVLAAVLVLSLAPAGAGNVGVAGVQESFRIDSQQAGPDKKFEAFDAVTIAAFDLDGDGVKEIITHNDNNNVYVFSGADGSLIAELETRHSSTWNSRELSGISVGDVTGNNRADLLVTNSAGWLTAFEARPSSGESKIEFVRLWERFMDPHKEDPDYSKKYPWVNWNGQPGLDGSVYLADVTGDGKDEIFLQLDDVPGMYALTGDGKVYGWEHWSDGNANPVATDLTGDGRIETVYASDGGRIVVFDAKSFKVRCTFESRDHGVHPASISVAPTVVDLTGDGKKEIVFGARNAEKTDDPEWFKQQNAHYFALRSDCSLLWHQTWDWGNPHAHMHPIPVDVTGDGRLDVLFQDWNTVGHKPGNWQVTGKPNLFAVHGTTGELIWRVETNTFWSNKNLALADVTGDGRQELLVNDALGGKDGVSLFDLDGKRIGFFGAPSGWNVNRGPSVVDLNGDGKLQIVLPIMRGSDHCTRNLDVGCREGALQVYSTSGSGEPIWPNVKTYNNAYDDLGVKPGTIRSDPKPGNGTDPTTGPGGGAGSQNGSQSQDEEMNETGELEAEGVNTTGEDPDSSGASAGSGGGGGGGGAGGGGASPSQTQYLDPVQGSDPPVITMGDWYRPGESHGAMEPLVVHVSGNTAVESVMMELGQKTLDVEIDGQTARHTPMEPLPSGNHTLRVTATNVDGESATMSVELSIHEGETLEPQDPVDEPRFPDGAGDSDPDPEAEPTPLGLMVVLMAVVLLLGAVAYRRRAP